MSYFGDKVSPSHLLLIPGSWISDLIYYLPRHSLKKHICCAHLTWGQCKLPVSKPSLPLEYKITSCFCYKGKFIFYIIHEHQCNSECFTQNINMQ